MVTAWRKEQKAFLKKHLYETALHLFEKQGYEQTTVAQITKKAQVAKGTFFNYFASKDHLLLFWYQALHDPADFEIPEDQSAVEAIISMSVKPAARAIQSPHLLAAKLNMGATTSVITEEEREQDRISLNHYVAQLQKGKRNGELKQDFDEVFFAELMVTHLTGLSRRWAYEGQSLDMVAAMERDLRYLFRLIQIEGGGQDVA